MKCFCRARWLKSALLASERRDSLLTTPLSAKHTPAPPPLPNPLLEPGKLSRCFWFSDVSEALHHSWNGNYVKCIPRKPRGEAKKCRKVYGMEKRDLWCTACRWKKACQRFTDWASSFTPLRNVLFYCGCSTDWAPVSPAHSQSELHELRCVLLKHVAFLMSLIPPGHKGCSFLTASIVEHWDW